MGQKVRSSNLELLRIAAMYMIIFIHANRYLGRFCGGALHTFCNGFVNGICNTGVTCFILISGYCGMKFSITKLVKMECMMITYSCLETAVMCLAYPQQMRGGALLEALVKAFLPVVTRKYWFYSCYVCLYLSSGFLQKWLEGLEKREFRNILILMLVLFSVFPTLFYFEIVPDNGKGLVQMTMVYLLGRYIKMHRDIPLPRRKALPVFVCLWLVNGISHEFPLQIGGISHHLCKDNSITNIGMAVILFFLFKEWRFRSAFVNGAASCLFAAFALNNTLVQVVMDGLERHPLPFEKGLGGFAILAGIVSLVLFSCILIGKTREWLLGRADRFLGEWFQKLARSFPAV